MSAPNVMDVAQLQALVSRSPFHRWLGLQVVSVTDDGVEVLAPWREELMSNPDVRIVHGGVVAALVASGRGAYITRRWAPRTQEAA